MSEPLTDEQIVARAIEFTAAAYPAPPDEADVDWQREAAAVVAALRAAGRLAEPEHVCGACGADQPEVAS